MINPFLSSSSSNNMFTSNLISNNKANDIFKTNNTNNNYNQTSLTSYNPFKVNNNNNISTNNNDIFSRIKTNITDNTSNNNSFMNNMNNPFRTGNTNTTNMFNNNNNMFNTGSNFSFQNQNVQNYKEYNFGFGLNTRLPICQTVGKSPITTFDHDIKFIKDYSEKNRIGQMDYNNARLEYICNDENLKNFSVEEIRMNDYINAKIQFFDKWSNDNFNPNNQPSYSNTNNFTSNIFNNNNNNNTFSIFNPNNRNVFDNNGNNNTNPFLNTNNNNTTTYNPFNNNNNNKSTSLNNNNNNNMFNNNNLNNNPFNNNPFNNVSNKNTFNTNNNIFNNNTNNSPFNNNNNNNIFLNNNNYNPFNNNNTNNIFNRNNIFNNNSNNNIFNNNNNNIFNNNNQNPFNSVLNRNNNNNNIFNNSINNNNLVNNIFNNNANNFMEKPFEEKIKDPTWVKRNVKIISNKDLDNWISGYMDDISKVNLRVKEMQYFSNKDEIDKINPDEEIPDKSNLVFNKIILSSDEEISKYNIEKEKSEKNLKKNTSGGDTDDEKNEDTMYEDIYKNEKRWDPIYIQNNNNETLDNIYTLKKEKMKNNNNFRTDKGKINGFAEASKILSNFDDEYEYVDFNFNNKEPKEFILPTEKQDFIKFNNNMMSNRQSYMSSSGNYNNNMYNNNNSINVDMDLNSNHSNNHYYISNESNYQNINMNIIDNKNSIKDENSLKNNIINKTNSNKTTKINSDEINRNLVIMEENINNEEGVKNDIYQNECKLIFSGECGNIPELKMPIIIQFSSIILPNENLLNFDAILDIIIKNIQSIENIQDKILLPKKEDIYLKLGGKIYSKLTTTEININQVDKYIEDANNYYYIYYGFKLQRYPLLLNDVNDIDNKYMTNPKLDDILNPENNYDLKKIENFEIWNKYGKIIFLEPIDLSGKIILNDIIKIKSGDIDLSHKRVDKLKAKAFLYYDFGDKLDGIFLENIKYMIKKDNGNFIKYENQVLEYTINC